MFRIGRVLRASGLGGELRVQFFRPRRSPVNAGRGEVVLSLADGTTRRLRIERARFTDPQTAVVRLSGIVDRDAAEAVHGASLDIDLADPPPFITDELDRAIDARVVDRESGAELGTLVAVQDNGAQAILVIENTRGAEVLVPYVPALVAGIERAGEGGATRVLINLIPGLFDLEQAE